MHHEQHGDDMHVVGDASSRTYLFVESAPKKRRHESACNTWWPKSLVINAFPFSRARRSYREAIAFCLLPCSVDQRLHRTQQRSCRKFSGH